MYGRPRPCRTKSESQASTPQLRQQTGAKASARRSLDQAAPGQSQDTHQDKQRRGKLPPSKHPPQLRQQTGARANARRSPDQAAPRHAQDTHRDKQRRGKHSPSKHPPRQTPATTRQADRRQGTRRANPSGQATPDQAAPGIQTEIASLNGDRRFQLQRSGTISSGPLKKLRVSCVHERDGKQVPCVRSLCSYARESRAC